VPARLLGRIGERGPSGTIWYPLKTAGAKGAGSGAQNIFSPLGEKKKKAHVANKRLIFKGSELEIKTRAGRTRGQGGGGGTGGRVGRQWALPKKTPR